MPILHRQERLTTALRHAGLDALALNPGPTLTYLTGMHFHLMERPIVALFRPDAPLTLILPELETPKVEGAPFALNPFPYGEDPSRWGQVFGQALQAAGLDGKRIGVESTRLRYLELHYLQAAAPQANFVDGSEVIGMLRMRKDSSEIMAMRKAVAVAQQALLATLPLIRPGMSEKELASELVLQLLRHGSEPELPFFPIVAGGPNSANPHAVPTDRPLQRGELLLIDWGATVDGYYADLTRTFALGEVPDEMQHIAAIVAQANAAGRAAARPNLPAGAVDAAARQVIREAGYAAYFTHRTGHGLGMDTHEPPYMYAENTLTLAPGMTFTVEPGIYLPGLGGVRIEDDVVITAEGAESLSDLPRSLEVLA
ncbi:MAG: aminopeptidase P family protein [Anaerolineales bacterium]